MKRLVELPVRPLTTAQRELFESQPDVPALATRAAIKGMGRAPFRHLAFDDMVSIASIGGMEATQHYDPAEGTPYRTFMFWASLLALLEAARLERLQHAKVCALIRASARVFFSGAQVDIEIGVDTDESLLEKLHGFSNTLIGLAVAQVATTAPTPSTEDELGERQEATRAGDALRALLPPPGSPERAMIDLHFVQGLPLTKVAEAMGVDKSKYWTFWRGFHALMASLREGMEARGIERRPAWREDVSGRGLTPPDDGP